MAEDVFGEQLGAWRSWQSAPWGRLRYAVVAETLGRGVRAVQAARGGGALSVLDVGGGDGRDVLPLAGAGHDVTVVDPSAVLLGELVRAADEQGVRVRAVEAGLDDLEHLALPPADVVMCHTVLQYREDPTADVGRLAGLVAPGGALSVLAPNPPSDVFVAAVREPDLAGALAVLDAATVHAATFGEAAQRLHRADVEDALVAAGLQVSARYGVRCVGDLLPDDGRKHDPAYFEDLLRLEVALCDRSPYRDVARLWQVVARRPAGEVIRP